MCLVDLRHLAMAPFLALIRPFSGKSKTSLWGLQLQGWVLKGSGNFQCTFRVGFQRLLVLSTQASTAFLCVWFSRGFWEAGFWDSWERGALGAMFPETRGVELEFFQNLSHNGAN